MSNRIFIFSGRTLWLGLFALSVSGCASLRSEYQRPEVTLPSSWQQAVTGQTVLAGDRWWQAFADPTLDALLAEMLARNNDLALAGLKLRQARLAADLVARNLYPTPSADVTQNINSWGSTSGQKLAADHSTSLNADLRYELDLWGKLASQRDAARWQAEASEQDRAATALSMIGKTAENYWDIANLNETIALGEASLQDTRRALELTRVKYQAGAVSGQDLLQAEQAVASQEAGLIPLRQQLMELRHELALLFDGPPERSFPEQQSLQSLRVPEVPAGLPAELLARRPDLRASELQLRATLADVDTARLSLYPDLSLTGSAGVSSLSLSQLLSNPTASLGATLNLPFVDWHKQQLEVQKAENGYDQAVVNFRKSLYSALRDVENCLSARVHYQQQAQFLTQSLALAKRSEQLAEVRYREGATGVQQWLDEQKKRRDAESALAQNRLDQLKNQMKLYQALGGGAAKAS